MGSPHIAPKGSTTVERRLTAVESRVADVEDQFGQTIYAMRRELVEVRIVLARMAEAMNVSAVVTSEEIDAVLDDAEESDDE